MHAQFKAQTAAASSKTTPNTPPFPVEPLSNIIDLCEARYAQKHKQTPAHAHDHAHAHSHRASPRVEKIMATCPSVKPVSPRVQKIMDISKAVTKPPVIAEIEGSESTETMSPGAGSESDERRPLIPKPKNEKPAEPVKRTQRLPAETAPKQQKGWSKKMLSKIADKIIEKKLPFHKYLSDRRARKAAERGEVMVIPLRGHPPAEKGRGHPGSPGGRGSEKGRMEDDGDDEDDEEDDEEDEEEDEEDEKRSHRRGH